MTYASKLCSAAHVCLRSTWSAEDSSGGTIFNHWDENLLIAADLTFTWPFLLDHRYHELHYVTGAGLYLPGWICLMFHHTSLLGCHTESFMILVIRFMYLLTRALWGAHLLKHSPCRWGMMHISFALPPQYYEEVWSNGAVELLDGIMAEGHEQHDKILQPGKFSVGRSSMAKGIVGYRRAYPDLK